MRHTADPSAMATTVLHNGRCSVGVVPLKNATRTIALAVLSICLAAVFWILNAPWVALFQLMIYGGAVTVLLISTVALTERYESGDPVEELDSLTPNQ